MECVQHGAEAYDTTMHSVAHMVYDDVIDGKTMCFAIIVAMDWF